MGTISYSVSLSLRVYYFLAEDAFCELSVAISQIYECLKYII